MPRRHATKAKNITYRGLMHSVLNDISRSSERGPRPFDTHEFTARLKDKATLVGRKLGTKWHSLVLNALHGAVNAGLVRTRGAGQFSVTKAGRASYRLTRREMREGQLELELSEPERAAKLMRLLDQAAGPLERRTKAQILIAYQDYRARNAPQRCPLAELQWQSQSTVTDWEGSQQGSQQGADDAIALDPAADAAPADDTATVRTYSTARSMPAYLKRLSDEHLARDRAYAAAGAYPTPDSVERLRGDLEDREDPVTPTRGGAANNAAGNDDYYADGFGGQHEDYDDMDAEAQQDDRLPQAGPSAHRIADWASTVMNDDQEAQNHERARRYLTRTESSYTIASEDYIHPTVQKLQQSIELVTQERDEARAAYARDAELFDVYPRGIEFLRSEDAYMLKCKLDKANEKIEILKQELAELRQKGPDAAQANEKLLDEMYTNNQFVNSIERLSKRDNEAGAGPSEELLLYIKHKDLSDAKIAQLEKQVGPVHAQCLRAQQMLAAYAEEDARLAEEMRLRAERRQEALAALNQN